MNKVIFYIKKFFAIFFSFLFGAFHSDKKQEKETPESKEDNVIKKDKRGKTTRIVREDEESTKSLSNQKKKIDEALYYAKKDIQKLMMIQKNIIDLEYQINSTNNLEDLYQLEKELVKEKSHLEKIANYYDKIDMNSKEIKDVKSIILENRKLIKDKEKVLSKKIYNENKKTQEEVIEENLDQELEKPLEEKSDSHDEITEEKQVADDKEAERKLSSTLTPILELITIKEITDIIKTKKKSKVDNLEESSTTKSENQNIVVKVENKEKEKIESRKEKIDKNLVITKVNSIQKKQKKNNLSAINKVLSKAKNLVQQVNLNSLLQMNAMVAINTSLTINNYIRSARSLTGKRVKKLKLDKVIRKVGNNPKIMVKAMMNNSLSEIRKLKAELKQYELSDELIEALNSLNEMELEILSQIQEIENIHNLNQSHTR